MNKAFFLLTILTSATMTGCQNTDNQMINSNKLNIPIAEKKPKELVMHGHKRTDNYFWLNERENSEVIKYLETENTYTEQSLKHTVGLQDKIYNEIVNRIKQDDESVPFLSNGYYYFSKNIIEKEYAVICRKKGNMQGVEEIILDENEMAEGHNYFSAVGYSVSPNNSLIAIGIDTISRRQYNIHFKNLNNSEFLEDVIPNTTGGCVWANDNKTVFYTRKDETTLRAFQIFKHIIGTPSKEDVIVYEEKDETFDCYVSKSKSNSYIFIESSSTLTTETRYLDANHPNGEFKIFEPREKNHEYSVWHYQDKFYIVTNWNAQNFRLMTCKLNKTERENWKEEIAHRPDVLLDGINIFKNHMVIEERKNGLSQIKVINTRDNSSHYIEFDEEVYVSYPGTNKEFDSEILRFDYMSLTTPHCVYDYDMNTKKSTLLKQQEILGDFRSDNYHSERLYATANDGVQIPISLVYKKGIDKNGNNPLLLYGYGSYGASMDPYFSQSRLSLLDRGFVFAIAHIRGGQEMGRQWYEDGKLLTKKNTFTDFISCGEHLIKNGYTSKEKLCAMGGSAGGLLIGAIINMRPDLFKAAVAQVPFVDVVTTMLDETIPLTTSEYDEWGNPNDKTYYDYMLSYSPYDNIEAKAYPNLLITTGLHDSQVQYWEPAKWAAKLRALKTDTNALYLYTNMEAGHGGASGRFKQHKETALEYSFLLDQLGIKE